MIDLFKWIIKGPFPLGSKETDTEYKISECDGFLDISFKGSTTRRDWIENFRAWPMYKHMGTPFFVHAGFRKKYHSIRDDFLEMIGRVDPTMIRIFGISGGAPIAALALEDINYNFPRKAAICEGYACPRFIWLPSKRIRFRWYTFHHHFNGNDIVTKLPPAILGYRHVGFIHQYGEKRRAFKWDVKAHSIAEYKRVLEAGEI